MLSINSAERRRRLVTRHRLHPLRRTNDPAEIARDLVALHSSDPVTPFLSILTRQEAPSVQSVERALYEDRALLRHHAMRRTIWLTDPAIVPDMHASSTRKLAAAERRTILKHLPEGEDWMNASLTNISDFLTEHGPTDTRSIGEALPHLRRATPWPAGKNKTIDIPIHTKLMVLGGFEARFVRGRPLGSWVASQYVWALRSQWTPAPIDDPEISVRSGAAGVLRRWLAAFGPGTMTDLRWWTGWTKAQVVQALEDLGAVNVALPPDRSDAEPGEPTGWVLAHDLDETEDLSPSVALLPSLDSTSMAWKQRSWYLEATTNARITDRWGNIGPTVWRDGRIVGGWAQHPSGELRLDLDAPLGPDHRELLDDEIRRLQTALSDTRFRIRFPVPNQTRLLV